MEGDLMQAPRDPEPAPEPTAMGPGASVERDDPGLFATTLFAPASAQKALLALYAFDVELSRATASSAEPLIPYMRLQWWRDITEAAQDGAPPPAHEVAGPFARLIVEHRLPVDLIESMIAAREIELAGDFDHDHFLEWAYGRFGALTALGVLALTGEYGRSARLARHAGPVLGRSEEHTSELQSRGHLVCRLLLEKKKRRCKKITPSSTNEFVSTAAGPCN